MNSQLSYISPSSLSTSSSSSIITAAQDNVALAASLLRQRSLSSDSLAPGAKRPRSNDHSSSFSSLSSDPTSLEQWLQAVAANPSSLSATASATTATSLDDTLAHFEQTAPWQQHSSSSQHTTVGLGLGGVVIDTPLQHFHSSPSHTDPAAALLPRINGIASSFHPTPSTSPSAPNDAARPPNNRASTAPVRNLAALRARAAARCAAIAAAGDAATCSGQFGTEVEMRVGGPVEQQSQVPHGRSMSNPGTSSPPTSEGANKDRFVAGLVGASVLAIESIWGPSPVDSSACSAAIEGSGSVLPLHWFVKEVLRRSRTSCSTLQLALYYLHKSRREIREVVARADATRDEFYRLEQQLQQERDAILLGDSYPSPPLSPVSDSTITDAERFSDLLETQNSPILCGRRMFLASLIAASKYLQDRNYSNKAWARISGLPINEINVNERSFLNMIKFELHLPADDFLKWTERLAALTAQGAALESAAASPASVHLASAARLGLARSQSELSVPEPTQGLMRPPPISVCTPEQTNAIILARLDLARANTDPELASRQAQLVSHRSTLAQRNLPTMPIAPSLAALNSIKPASLDVVRQTASPATTDEASASSSSDEDSETSSRRSTRSSTGRKVRNMPLRRAGVPMTRAGSSSISSSGVPTAWPLSRATSSSNGNSMDVGAASGWHQQGWNTVVAH